MRKIFMTCLLLMSTLAHSNDEGVKSVADAWLSMVDAKNYTDSWKGSDPIFQAQVSPEAWDSSMKSVREPLGDTKSREFFTANRHTSLPGMPDGDYFVLQFNSVFASKASAVETLVMRKTDNNWMPVGYFIK